MKKITLVFLFCGAMALMNPAWCQTASSKFKLPAYEKFTLPNGLTFFLMEQREVPVISVSAVIPAGAVYDGVNAGLANQTALGLQYGTKSYTKAQIEEELDFIGAELDSYAGKESAGLSARFASKDADKVLAILKEVLADPVFNEEEFLKERKRHVASLAQAKQIPRNVINAYWDKFLFGTHVYSSPVSGSTESVGKLEVDDLRSFYSSRYTPSGSAIAVVGDFNSPEMKKRLTKLFSGWKTGKRPVQSISPEPVSPAASARVLLVNKDDARETTFLIGGPGVARNNPDYVAIEVVNTVLGGRFTSWLNDELRVNTGLTYGANSRFNSLKHAGTFAISTFTSTPNTEAAIDKVLEVLDSLHRTGVNELTLNSAKNYVKGQFPPRYETSAQLAALLTQMYWYGFDESFINNFQSNVDRLTVEGAREVIKKYFPKERLQFVMIGKADELRELASKYGTVTEKQIRDDGF